MGIVFQIIDDVLNFSDSPEWRKVQGEDLKAGKPTYAIIRAIGMLAGTESERLKEILCTPALREDAAIQAEGIALVRKSGAVEWCTEEAVGMIEESWRQFSGHIPPRPQNSCSGWSVQTRYIWHTRSEGRHGRNACEGEEAYSAVLLPAPMQAPSGAGMSCRGPGSEWEDFYPAGGDLRLFPSGSMLVRGVPTGLAAERRQRNESACENPGRG